MCSSTPGMCSSTPGIGREAELIERPGMCSSTPGIGRAFKMTSRRGIRCDAQSGSLGIPAQRPLFSGRGIQTKDCISAQIKCDSLEDVFQIEDAIATAFQYLNSVIEPLNETTCIAIPKVICNTIHMVCHEFQKSIEACQSAFFDDSDPLLQVLNRFSLRVERFKDSCQRLTECICLAQLWCGGK